MVARRIEMPRLSRAYFSNVKQDNLDGLAFMFTRDVHTGIMPFRNGRTYPFTIKLARKNQRLEDQLKEFLDVGAHGSRNQLDETVWNIVDILSHRLAGFGDAYLEIVYDSDKSGLNGKKLEFVPHGKIVNLFSRYIQLVPVRDWKRNEKKFYIIPSNRIWHVKLPRKLGTPRQHRKMLKQLSLLSEPMPKFALKTSDTGNSEKYDFTAHRKARDIAIESATSRWGSISSLGRIEGTTEYYQIVNGLQAAYSKASLREHIINEVNSLLARLGIRNSLKVTGLKTSVEIDNAIQKLERGEIGFTDAINATKD